MVAGAGAPELLVQVVQEMQEPHLLAAAAVVTAVLVELAPPVVLQTQEPLAL